MLDRWKSLGCILGLIMFWIWNIIAVLVVLFAVVPHLFVPLITATFSGELPLSISACLFVLMLLPFLALYVGAVRRDILAQFFYGFEMPILVLTLLRIFLVRELTFASAFLIGTGLVAVTAFGWRILKKTPQTEIAEEGAKAIGSKSAYGQTVLASLILITGVFVAILSALYALPIFVNFAKGFFSFNWLGDWLIHPLLALIMILFGLSMIVLAVFPLYIGYYYPKMWKDTGSLVSDNISKKLFWGLSGGCVIAWAALHGVSSLQPNANYVTALNKMTPAEQKIEMQQDKKVRKQLLKAYLNEYRYIGRAGDESNVKELYTHNRRRYYSKTGDHQSYGFYRDGIGGAAQSIQNYLLSPLLYKGRRNDGETAGKLYSELFDVSIQRAERGAISKALEATYNRDEVTAGLMNIGARNVLLLEQNVNFEDKGDYAAIEIEEAYENLTFEPQEIFYYFSLPEDAAITGLWIGRTPERDRMDAFIVAPRGAAQKVYEEQIRRRIDPALLEQVGPSQYRLRVFPIPVTKRRASSSRRNRRPTNQALNPMRMHLRYVVPLGPDGFARPELLEKRNVNWSRKTKYSINGKPVKVKNSWMPTLPDAQNRFDDNWHLDTGFIAGSLNWEANSVIDYSKAIKEHTASEDDVLPTYAVLIDTSYSMNKHRHELSEALSAIKKWQGSDDITLNYFALANGEPSTSGKTPPLEDYSAESFNGFGTITPQMMLRNFRSRKGNKQYHGVIILTDQGRYAQKPTLSPKNPVQTDAPIWFVHFGQAACAYDDEILDAIYRSGGGVAQDIPELRNRLYYQRGGRRAYYARIWTAVRDTAQADKIPVDENIAALAARQHILASSYGTPPTPENLDILHDIAKRHSVITPYSSMIVLVNERQKEALKKASEADDRFEREGRNGEEALTSPSNITVSAVPEPHEWLLILLSLLMLIVIWKKREVWR